MNSRLHRAVQVTLRIANAAVELGIIAFFVVTSLFSAYTIYDTNKIYKAADVSNFETYRPDPKGNSPSFQELQAMNDDVIGWLQIYGTGIDYPLLYSKEFNKYINKNPEGEFALSGSIFIDDKNNPHLKDFKTIIYGHHMEDSLMFGDLDKFRKQEFFRTHEYGKIYYDGKYHGLEIFAYFQGDAYDDMIYNVDIPDAASAQAFLDYVDRQAVWSRDLGVSPKDHIVVLSTCAGDTNGRYLLAARITEKVFKDPYPVKEDKTFLEGPGKNFIRMLPFWWWIMLPAALLLMILLIKLGSRRSEDKNS